MAKRSNGEGTICKRSDGRWMISVMLGRDNKTGKIVRKYCYGKSKSEVLKKKEALLDQRKGPVYIDADKVTVGQWVEKWLTIYAKASVRENTYAGYRSVVVNHIQPLLGDIKLQKLRGIDIQNMVNQIKDTGGGPRLAELTFAVLRIALNKAFHEEILQRLPFKTVSLPKKRRKEFTPLTATEWVRLFAVAETDAEMYTALLLEWATGISRSELLGLKWIDFNFTTDNVSIRRAVIITDHGPKLDDTKTNARQRVLPLPEVTMQQIRLHQEQQNVIMSANKHAWENNDLVFPNFYGKLQDPRSWSKKFQKIAQRANLSITFHKLRHDHASRLSENGASIKDAQYRLGHSTTQMLLNVYTHRISGGQEKIASWLNSSFPTAPTDHETPLH
ncbi:Tyrosine recombinase XerC [Sporomusa silvacetica DSM 10669]|uniref:Tyrosine recombinase XerC n=1 Tax=Sporomusa silvacetica DSM 10669 TaxID=1123289 RepID=A0ABZ3INQ2_9FIRM|nr:site-specific integrase [Sporomusa silvacetica]OZC14692.1 tyrosine recombinase XerC [Sporomusa silvacetica DSM 10669]